MAIVLNELIANAIEHGFGGLEHGEIRISGVLEDGAIVLRIADDGRGLPTGFTIEHAEGMGLQLVRRLVESELHGSVWVHRLPGNPDLVGTPDQGGRVTDPLLPIVGADLQGSHDFSAASQASQALPERYWTVTELRFPMVITEPR